MTRMRVTLLTAGDPTRVTGGHLFHRRMADRAERHAAQVTFLSVPDLPLPWGAMAGPWWLGRPAIRHADVLVLDSIAAAAAAPWLGALGVPLVGMVHQPLGGMDGPSFARRLRRPLDRLAYRATDLLMVASEWLAEQLVADAIPRGKLRVVVPGRDVAPDETEGGDDAASRVSPRKGRMIAALCVANWLPRKGIVELLESVRRLDRELLTLHLVGDTAVDRRHAARISELLAAPELRDRVVVHGLLPATAVRALYRRVDLFVLPSFEEPYGTVWGEAMANGLPVVGWRAGNLPFLAEDRREGLLAAPGDVVGLANAIERLARDPELRVRMGTAAAARAAARPSWDDSAAIFFATLREAARGGRGRYGGG